MGVEEKRLKCTNEQMNNSAFRVFRVDTHLTMFQMSSLDVTYTE